jgi:polysaccharide biosynthesis/export protein
VRNRTVAPRDGKGIKDSLIPLLLVVLLAGFLSGCGGSHPPSPPPEIAPSAADSAATAAGSIPAEADSAAFVAADSVSTAADTLAAASGAAKAGAAPVDSAAAAPVPVPLVPEMETYQILVDDELTLMVVGYPELSGPVRVLPDGNITVPGAGSVYLLGASVTEATAKVNEALATIVRFPRATVSVTKFGERRVFVMGEVVGPGDHAYHRGLTVVGAIAQAGGFNNFAKRSSVIVLRRMGEQEAIAFRVDARGPLRGKHLEQDLPLRPYDIVYVPKTFIASVGVLLDQYFAQLTPPFSLYLTGWYAFHVDDRAVRIANP